MATQAQSQVQAKALGSASGAADANASGGARTRPLTSTPCLPSATANSALFQRVPPEIRRLILVEAFGGSPMHFDLRLLHPLKKHPPKRSGTHGHSAPDDFAPRQWQWCSSVCHNVHHGYALTSPGYEFFDLDDLSFGGQLMLHMLRVLRCSTGQTGYALKEHIYCVGYRTPCCLSVVLRLGPFSYIGIFTRGSIVQALVKGRNIPPGSDIEGFISLLNIFPEVLPNITFLYLSLQGNLGFPAVDRRGTSEGDEMTINASEELLQLVDQMVVKLHRLSHCHISLPTSYFRALNFKENGIRFTPHNLFSQEPLWRVLPVQNDSQQEEGARPVLKGYWIRPGEHDWYHPQDYIPGQVLRL
ncbi:conserved hypothetical protein [Coccidioides posadasii str. Silveira]|uniref:Uncharacterized protein n=2 Tax=Coccidioides posadasii (strain RMSCC 757 / Silveira) TaxID=443226 RepID=E9D5D0_COCPS|nr:conserved hypothetical protein [Coccidioides posadasii str. Silveira]